MLPDHALSPSAVEVDVAELRSSAEYVHRHLRDHLIGKVPFRFGLELFHRALFNPIPIVAPSLEIGIGDGSSSWFMHRGKPNFDYGGDMPYGATLESCGMDVAIQFDRYDRMVGMDMADIPFPDDSIASIFSSHTMAYGQNLRRTYAEILRVLMPGGRCTFAVDIDEWEAFPAITEIMRRPERVPSFEVHPKEYHIELLRSLGATEIAYRTFFTAALEAMFQAGVGAPMDRIDAVHSVLLTLLERELSQPVGPADAFNLFITFTKPGALPHERAIPDPVCTVCRSPLAKPSRSELVCPSCGARYPVRSGLPIMLRSDHPGYSPTSVRQRAERLMEATDALTPQMLTALGAGRYVIVNDAAPLWTGYPAPRILLDALRTVGYEAAGIFDRSLPAATSWHGVPIVHAGQLSAPATLLALTHDGGEAALVQRAQEAGARGPLVILVFGETADRVDARISQFDL